jgi:hypothetical protein
VHKKVEALCLELGDKDGLQTSYANQAVILHVWGRLKEAFEWLKKQETLCLESVMPTLLSARGYGTRGITPPARPRLNPAFPVSRFLESKESWRRSSLTCRAAERATRAASQFYALRPRTALLHTSPHPPEHE